MRLFYLICLCLIIFASLFALHPTSVYADTYAYDGAGRLTSVAYSNGMVVAYTYDNAGNMLSRTIAEGLKGDVNGNFIVDLADTILALKIACGVDVTGHNITTGSDVNEDGKIGLEEVIYILQKISGLRQ